MKQQYSSNYDDPFVANERLKNKLDFLERESLKRQNYVKELERNLKITKQTLKSITDNNPKQHQFLLQLQNQNTHLLQKLKEEYLSICKLNALYLMECQLRIEESKSFNQRIKDFEETMADLRRYLHDKEESFSFVAEKLKKFEQLLPNQQLTMYEKLINYSGIVKEDVTWKSVLTQILQDRDLWKKQYDEASEKCKRLQILNEGIRENKQFSKFQSLVNSLSQQLSNKLHAAMNSASNSPINSLKEQKNQANLSTNLTYSQTNKKLSIEPNVELIRLMKKQKLSNKILEAALTEAIQKNLELIQNNKKLIDSNDHLTRQIDFIIADMVVLCDAFTKYDQNYRTKLRLLKHRAKCDLDRPSYQEIINKYKNNELGYAKEILFTKMRSDVEQMTQYIALCPLQKVNSIRSFQSPRKGYIQSIDFQLSINGKQLEVSEI